jgi:Asp-tRNA(Asn)/Glu-tRNA(Gln) amidotransferase A subunit family amidase
MNSFKINDDNLENYISSLCKNIDVIDKSVHAFLPETGRYERLLNEAKLLEKQDKNSLPLFGLTVGVKDIFYIDGLPTRAGSNLPPEAFHGKQADIITKLKNAGALIIGKTVTAEFAFAVPNETVNPLDNTLTPGGSSSGSAAAVAADLCNLGIGTQTVGSTLRPASYCGIVGFKCSYGRINSDGVIYFSPSLDTVGLFTKKIEHMIPIAKIIMKNWKDKKLNRKPVLGIPTGKYLYQAEPDILKIFEQTIALLKLKGYHIKQIPMFEDIEKLNENIWTLASYEMAEIHKEWYPKYKDLYRERTKNQVEIGLKIDKNTYQKMLDKQKKVRELIEDAMKEEEVDFWITPAATSYPPKMSTGITGNPAMNIPWTFAGLPSLSVPIKNSGKLPLGLQIVGGYGKDEMILYESLSIEKNIQ